MASDVMKDGRFFVRIVCAEGIHVLHQSGHTPIQGNYSELVPWATALNCG